MDLCFQDLTICPNRVELTLKASKTDPFRQGVVIRLSANGTTLCPVSAMKRYLQACSNMTGPLFQFKDGRYLTRKSFMTALNLVKPHEINNMSTHSFRIGAATAAAAAGYPWWAIQALRLWSSDCYRTRSVFRMIQLQGSPGLWPLPYVTMPQHLTQTTLDSREQKFQDGGFRPEGGLFPSLVWVSS